MPNETKKSFVELLLVATRLTETYSKSTERGEVCLVTTATVPIEGDDTYLSRMRYHWQLIDEQGFKRSQREEIAVYEVRCTKCGAVSGARLPNELLAWAWEHDERHRQPFPISYLEPPMA